jgi:hypothetical protein
MREIVFEIKDFLKKDFNIYIYSFTVIFLGASILFNYTYNFDNGFIDKSFGKIYGSGVYFLYYLIPYLIVLILSLVIKKQTYKLKQREFWVKVITFFGIFGISIAFYQYRKLLTLFADNSSEANFLIKIFGNLKRIIPFLIVFYIIKRIYDKNDNHLYGLRYKGMNYKPFFIMLLLMIPLIAAASFLPSFQHSYPQFKFWRYSNAYDLESNRLYGIFLFAYAMDFVSIELLFRGALIIGMAKVLGREAVLPMVAAYVFIHFGKPPGEAISSFFGGFILGIHSLSKKNIFGGIVIHVGIAFLMELAAVLQHFYGK